MSPACGVACSAGFIGVAVLDAAFSSFAIALVILVSCQAAHLLESEVTFVGLSCAKYPKALCTFVWHSAWAHR